jgi:hypothetical protein
MSNRSHYELPGTYGGGAAREIPALVEGLAEEHLPVRLAEQLRERRERRTRHVPYGNGAVDEGPDPGGDGAEVQDGGEEVSEA